MTTLAIGRHAKSDWADPGLDDHDRPLNARGERDAPRMARLLAERSWRPAAILSSTAVRARTTAEAYAEALGVPVTELPELYGASARELFDAAAASGYDDVLVVAHDPGMSALARHFEPGIPSMPTCAVATFRWPGGTSWADAAVTRPTSFSYDVPADLERPEN